jgi:hypothetical protein
MRATAFLAGIVLFLVAVPAERAQNAPGPLTNADVIKMAQAGLSEPAIVATIQSNPGNYDISADGLIALKQAGVTTNEINAIVTRASGGTSPADASRTTAQPGPAGSPNALSHKWRMPTVAVIQNGASQALPMEKTQLAQTKTKPTSMSTLSGDTVATEGLQAGVGTATMGAAMHMSSPVAGTGVEQAGTVFGGMMMRRKPTVTYVWGVPSAVSANVLMTAMPQFSVDFSHAPGANPEDYEPTIVKLTPAQNSCRIVGATDGKADAGSDPAADWEIYSHFLEDRVAVKAEKSEPGKYTVTPASELLPGEYAVVFRPISKHLKFSGGDVARAQGNGLMFDALWTFQVSENAQ